MGLLPGSLVTILVIAIAFLRFYDEQDFQFLSIVAQPQTWSNRLTVAALLAALANFGVEWNRRNREGNREAEERDRRAEATERETRRDRQEVRYQKAQIRYQLDPTELNRQELESVLAALEEYEQTLSEAISS
nr:hypothetical protein [Nodosilinea sp. FACHB-13]